jgi:hypothetical protein
LDRILYPVLDFLISLFSPRSEWRFPTERAESEWEDGCRVLCCWCGKRFPLAPKIHDVITAITRNAGLSPEQSPCLELPEEAWEEPGLVSECPLCRRPIKYNPFIVDNRERY